MILYRHILRAHIGPFFFSFFTLMFIFLLQFIMKYVDDLVGKGLNAFVITELIVLNLAWMVVLAIPMSVLVAVLMAFGGLSSQNEITAMKASGVSLYRMMLPVLLASMFITYLAIEFNNKILPEANHKAKTLMIDIRKKKPTLTLNAGMFSQEVSGYSILVRKTFEHSNDLEGITIYDYTNPAATVVITAAKGAISFTQDFRKLIMDLKEGEIHQKDADEENQYRRLRFVKHRILMNTEGFSLERSADGTFQRGDRELSAQAMRQIVDSLKNINENLTQETSLSTIKSFNKIFEGQKIKIDSVQKINIAFNEARFQLGNIENQLSMINYNRDRIDEYLVEIYKKYSIPFACIVFVLIGAPLGIISRRGGFGIAATLSLGFFVLYWSSLIGGEKLADRNLISPWFGMWAANIILGVFGIYLTLRMGRETPAINWNFFQKFIPKSFRTSQTEEF
ncbi:MAG: LptF/LptG family permease [Bacteroidota bacterium]|nr:LptF/LptG family permease [Bacteroidota bacterium]